MIKIKRKTLVILGIIVLTLIFLCFAFYTGLTVKTYIIETEKINQPVRIVLLTDLHSCLFGKNQSKLTEKIIEQNPDIILMAGDIADDVIPIDGTIGLLEAIAEKYPCFYVSGNHEFWSGEVDDIKDVFRSYGVRVLEGENETVSINNQTVTVCGADDPEIGETTFNGQLESAFEGIGKGSYTILLSHRPERIAEYSVYDCDLVLSGHAHGGQWRIPLILNGLYAPNQGFFPKYAGGLYEYKQTLMIVSRGLSTYSTRIPRIFNPPELVVIDIRVGIK